MTALGLAALGCGLRHERDDLVGLSCPCLPGWFCNKRGEEPGVCQPAVEGLADSGVLVSNPTARDAATEEVNQTTCTPPLPGAESGPCPRECSECTGGTCIRRCGAFGGCEDPRHEFNCPPGRSCEVRCETADQCADLVVTCPADRACTVVCASPGSCRSLELRCSAGPASSCALDCAADTCEGAVVRCGPGACTATCDGQSVATPGCDRSCSGTCGCQPS